MSTVTKRFPSAKNSSDDPVPQFAIEPEAWKARALSTLADLLAAARDATSPMERRQLGRLEHVRIIEEAGSGLYELIHRLPGGPPD